MKFLEENLLEYLQRPEFADLYASMIPRTYSKLCRSRQKPSVGWLTETEK
jgi:hypothetical protein